MKITGNIINIESREIYHGMVEFENGRITRIASVDGSSDQYILPGFIDAHVHIESSMLVPSEFARIAAVHGTVATVSDPHEIANVMGIKGVNYMIENGKKVPFKFHFGAPSCVPATTFESAGAVIDSKGVEEMLNNPDILYLAEMMNYPGVLFDDAEVLVKIAAAKNLGKPIDGHAPGLRGKDVRKYINAGISTDHECFTYEEALEKLTFGMKILIREGSAAKNFNALIDLLPDHAENMMFCSDDKHPDDLIVGHINQLVIRALKKGCDLFDVLLAACINPVRHYNLDVGTLHQGDPADFIVVENLESFTVKETYIDGVLVAKNGETKIGSIAVPVINNFNTDLKKINDFHLPPISNQINVIEAINGEIVTRSFSAPAFIINDNTVSNIEKDILKITVVNRYQNSPPAIAFINKFNLKKGAIASCVGHDSHNIIAVGVDDHLICKAVNLIIKNKGGISAVSNNDDFVLPLHVAGIMTNEDGYEVAQKYAEIDAYVREYLGSTLTAPFMTLSFMALLVIPQLKLSDKGLFDGKSFNFTDLFI